MWGRHVAGYGTTFSASLPAAARALKRTQHRISLVSGQTDYNEGNQAV